MLRKKVFFGYANKIFATQKSFFCYRNKSCLFCFILLFVSLNFLFLSLSMLQPSFLYLWLTFFTTPVILLQFFFLAFISFIFAPQFFFVSNAVCYFCLKHWKLSYPWFFFLSFLYFSFAYFISICISVFFAAHFFPFYIFFVFVFYCYSTFLNIPHALSYLLLVASLLLATFFWPLLAM